MNKITYNKTFWMNVVLALLFSCLTTSFLYTNGFGILINKIYYAAVFGVDTLFSFVLSPIVPIATAYVLKTNKQHTFAKVLNVLQLAYVVLITIYVFSKPESMGKNILKSKVIAYMFTYIIPSIISLRALKKCGSNTLY